MSALLTITETAANALDSVVASSEEVADTAGVRVVPREVAPDGQPTLGLVLAESPESGDQVVDTGDHAPVFVASEAAELLDDKVLDAQVSGDRVAFVLGPQDPAL